MRRLISALGSLAIATFVASPATADCIPNTGVCAPLGMHAGLPAIQVEGQISIGLPPIVLPPILLPGIPVAPPPAAPAVPAPPASGPAPSVVVIPQPGNAAPAIRQPGYSQPVPLPYAYVWPQPAVYGAPGLGLLVRLDGALGFGSAHANQVYGLGGVGAGVRYRAGRSFGLELGFDLLGGHDYNEQKRVELTGSAGGLWYLNPYARAQVYVSGGFLADHARTTPNDSHASSADPTYTHVGGYGGLGIEVFATPRLAFHLDSRGVLRQRIGSDATQAPEFTDPMTGRTTNTSGGVVGTAGVVLYF